MGWRLLFYVAYVPIIAAFLLQVVLPEPMLVYLRKGDTAKITGTLQKANPEFVPKGDDEYVLNYVKAEKVPYKNCSQLGLQEIRSLYASYISVLSI